MLRYSCSKTGAILCTRMNALDAFVLSFQSTSDFPSWTSRVRSPSPALKVNGYKPSGDGIHQNPPIGFHDTAVSRIATASCLRARFGIVSTGLSFDANQSDELYLDERAN